MKKSNDTSTPGEVTFAFALWLSKRKQTVTAGTRHDSALMADLAKEFCHEHKLTVPEQDWHAIRIQEKRNDT